MGEERIVVILPLDCVKRIRRLQILPAVWIPDLRQPIAGQILLTITITMLHTFFLRIPTPEVLKSITVDKYALSRFILIQLS